MLTGEHLHAVQIYFANAMADMPPETWWVAVIALLILGTGAVVDLFKGIIPDPLIFFGMIGIVAAKGIYVAWPFAAHQMTWGLVAAAIIWAINEGWHRLFKHDALGMGDAKWSMLAVTCFGAMPVIIAWGIGALLGSVWIILQKIARRGTVYVHFAPFLFIGLVFGIWVAEQPEGIQSFLKLF
jgi:prepilin signal peptidase PulO-like enzyme (type II secretory pathway)